MLTNYGNRPALTDLAVDFPLVCFGCIGVIRSPKNSLVLNWKIPRHFPWLGGAEGDEGIEVFGCAEGVLHQAGR